MTFLVCDKCKDIVTENAAISYCPNGDNTELKRFTSEEEAEKYIESIT